ncbi:hypothetical protein D3C87_1323510 [compost metagenome]
MAAVYKCFQVGHVVICERIIQERIDVFFMVYINDVGAMFQRQFNGIAGGVNVRVVITVIKLDVFIDQFKRGNQKLGIKLVGFPFFQNALA